MIFFIIHEDASASLLLVTVDRQGILFSHFSTVKWNLLFPYRLIIFLLNKGHHSQSQQIGAETDGTEKRRLIVLDAGHNPRLFSDQGGSSFVFGF